MGKGSIKNIYEEYEKSLGGGVFFKSSSAAKIQEQKHKEWILVGSLALM